MRRISSTTRIDILKSESRLSRPGRAGRITYLSLLAALLLYVFDLVFGPLFYLSANGMLMRDARILAPAYSGTVAEISTSEGAEVTQGTSLLRLDSIEIRARIAEAAIELGRLQAELMERIERRSTVRHLIPEAEMHRLVQQRAMDAMYELRAQGLVMDTSEGSVASNLYHADRELVQLQQEIFRLDREIPQFEAFVASATQSFDALIASYSEGLIVAPLDGIIGELSVTLGEIVHYGDPMLRVFHGAPYVLAFIPTGRIFDVRPGQRVTVRSGFRSVEGQIEVVYPIAPALPPEFSLGFAATERQQLVRIALNGPVPSSIPLFSVVRVTNVWNPLSMAIGLIDRGISTMAQ